MGAAVMNIFSLSLAIPANVYLYAYGDLTVRSLVYCRMRNYLGNVWGQMARFCIVLACFDRYVLTSDNVSTRALSRPSIALWCMGIVTIIWHILPAHVLILFAIANGRCSATGFYYILYSVYSLLSYWFIPCLGMTVFGYMAYSNLKRLHARVQPVGHSVGNNRGNGRPHIIVHRRDRDLFVLVLSEVVFYIIMMLLYPGITLEVSITNYLAISKSLERIQIENFLMTISLFFLSITNAMPFYVYIFASKAFRNDFKKLLSTHWRKVKGRTTTIVDQNTVH
jgi:hypothetical protein